MKPKAVSPTKKQAKPEGQSRQRPEQADKSPVVEKTTKLQCRPISRTKSCYSASALTPKSVGRRMSSEGSSSGSSSGFLKSSFPRSKPKPGAPGSSSGVSKKSKPDGEASSLGLSKKCAPSAATSKPKPDGEASSSGLSKKERPKMKVSKGSRMDLTPMEQDALRRRLGSLWAEPKAGKENQGDSENVKPAADDKSKCAS